MASTMELSLPLSILFFFILASASASASQRRLLQSNSPQNLQTSFPSNPTPAFANYVQPPSSAQAFSPAKSHDNKRLTKAVVITALSSFVASSVVYGVVHWFTVRKYRKETNRTGEDRKLGRSRSPLRCSHCYNILNLSMNERNMEGRKIQNRPLLPSGSLNSSSRKAEDSNPVVAAPAPTPPPPPPPPPLPRSMPPPPPLPTVKKNLPPTAPIPPMPPRPNAPRSGTSTSPLGGGPSRSVRVVPGDGEGARAHAKLRPLHWDKVTALNTEHSMVWDKMNTDNSSFRFNDDLMESLFGYTATNQKLHNTNRNSADPFSSPSVQVCLLDPRKSQNSAIVIRSLAIGRQEILDALREGRGLGHDTLEKLSKIAPTKEEEKKILEFNADASTLADAESFLYSLLKAVPSPFLRLDAMLFRSSYEIDILHLKQSLQTLELACQELKSRGLFIKLLEVILKAGNRMNAGTARGNAKAFNLSALCKLSDVKSTDGKTTLLHFVVEEVVRLEGRRLAVNRSTSIRRSGSIGSSHSSNDSGVLIKASRDQKEKEYMTLGLPVVGGLSSELANVKKAAAVDFDALINSCLYIGERMREIRQFLNGCANDGFVKETKGFLEAASEEVRVVGEEQVRIMELVRRTTEYYQPGHSKEKGGQGQPLQLFVIVKDFLVMFDRVCTDITRNTQKKTVVAVVTQSRANATKQTEETTKRVVATFPNLPPRFMAESFKYSSGSDSEDEF